MLPPPAANPKLGWRLLDTAGVVEKFGVPPAQIADYLALVGDTSDNIPGIAGVGPKTAAKWLAEWGSLEGVIAHAAELKPERFREPVAAEAEKLRRNLKLTTLNLALPTVAAKKTAPDSAELLRLLEEFGMRSTLAEARVRYAPPPAQGELF
jgi:DNA polymerase-1